MGCGVRIVRDMLPAAAVAVAASNATALAQPAAAASPASAVKAWTAEQVYDWLCQQHFTKAAQVLRANEIEGRHLHRMTEASLIQKGVNAADAEVLVLEFQELLSV